MSTDEINKNNGPKADDTLKPVSAEDLIEPREEIKRTSPEREHKIRNFQEKLGVSRDIAERMVDESGG